MIYAEAAYFDGAHVQHIADYQEHQRVARLKATSRKLAEQAGVIRAVGVAREPDALDFAVQTLLVRCAS